MFVLAFAGLAIAMCLASALHSVQAGAIAEALSWTAGSIAGAGVAFMVLRSAYR